MGDNFIFKYQRLKDFELYKKKLIIGFEQKFALFLYIFFVFLDILLFLTRFNLVSETTLKFKIKDLF